jgi:hypothetical protein
MGLVLGGALAPWVRPESVPCLPAHRLLARVDWAWFCDDLGARLPLAMVRPAVVHEHKFDIRGRHAASDPTALHWRYSTRPEQGSAHDQAPSKPGKRVDEAFQV